MRILAFLALLIWMLPKLWRVLAAVTRKISGLFGRSAAPT